MHKKWLGKFTPMVRSVKRAIVGSSLNTPLRLLAGMLFRDELLSDDDHRAICEIMRRKLTDTSVCVDIGCHKGAVLQEMLRLASHGTVFGVEPIPWMAARLKRRFGRSKHVRILHCALGEQPDTATFNYNLDHPAYSGLRRRCYPSKDDRVQVIQVDVQRLDDVIPLEISVDFIKIDVEGAELAVLRGGRRLIERCHPTIVFEFGTGSAEYYDSTPEQMFALFQERGYGISTLPGYLSDHPILTEAAFEHEFMTNAHYNFVARPFLHGR